MAVTVSNLVLPGPCRVYVGPASTAAPASSIAYGAAWAGSWVDVGATVGGVVAQIGLANLSVVVDQYNEAVAEMRIQDSIKVNFAAGEATLTNLKQAMGIGTLTTGSTESTFGVSGADTFVVPYAVGFETYAPNASSSSLKYRRLIVWKAVQTDAPALEGKKEQLQMVAYAVKGLIDTTQSASEQLWKLIDRVV